MEIKLSIIIPAFNVEKYIIRCLDSLYTQDLPIEEYEVIVVNDGSTDSTLSILMAYKKENLKILSQENQKQGAARNNGLKIAKGRYIWFVDADDWIEPNVFGKLYNRIFTSKVDILGFNCHDAQLKYVDCIIEGKELFRNLIRVGCFKSGPCFTLFDRNFLLFNNLFFLEKCIYEDSEYLPRVYYMAKKVLYINLHVYNYYYNQLGSTKKTSTPKWVCDNFIFLLLPSMKSFSDKIYRDDKVLARTFYFYTALTFNIFLNKLLKAQRSDLLEISKDVKNIKQEMIHCFMCSSDYRYWLEGIMLKLPFLLFFRIYKMIKQNSKV